MALLACAGLACKDAPTAYALPQTGPDTLPPVLQFAPARDTSVDSTGTLTVYVLAHDQSWVTNVSLVIINGPFAIPSVVPDTTDAAEAFPIALAPFKHSTFRWYVSASDILNHKAVSDTVTVSVR